MINIISSTIRLINKRYYKKLFLIQILIIFSSIIDLAGFAAIIPFFALVSDPSMVNREGIFMYLYKISGADNANEFIILFGGFLIFTFILRSFISSIRIWFSTYFANIVGFGIGDSLYQYYITRDLPFHIANSNSYLIKQITIEAIRVKNILKAFMQMNSNIITAIFIISIMIIYNPFVTVASSIIIASAYLLVNKKVNSTLINNGQVITESSKERLKILSNGFGSIKEIAMMSKEKYFFKKMKKTSLALARGTTINQVIPQVTNLFFQLIMFGGIISALLYLLSLHENDVRNVIPIFSAYALAAYKIIPAFQMVFKGLTEIKSNLPALKSIESDIKDMKSSIISNHNYQDYNKIEKDSAVFNSFELKDVYYRYGEKKTDVLKRINLKVK